MPDLLTVVGALAAICSTTSFAPQAWKIVRTADTGSISSRMYVITVLGFALWLAYGIATAQWPLIVTNAVCLALASFILAMKLLPQRATERLARRLRKGDPRA